MAVSPQLRDFVLDQLSDLGSLETTRLFGGLSVRCDGQHFGAILRGGTFYLVADPAFRADLEALGGTIFTYARRDRVIEVPRFVSVPEEILEDVDELLPLARRAIDIARRGSSDG
ncbi:DNA transformation protein [Breoghania corrubedonensis]|uniref:DNA transformation protein n=2 Tax=Breoghania corrubedonensis TaxID=665038 RepID=A0A2T5VEZ5_9HYPH|nr:DNA transformation protein [Breoghania corrubedonensis]